MINKMLFKYTANLPAQLITTAGNPYIERYYVGELFGRTFYLHRFISSDSERHLHNHPWSNGWAVILSGSYVEEVVIDLCPHAHKGCVTEFITRKWFNRIDGNTFHRIHSVKSGTWTLFCHGEMARIPGVFTPGSLLKGWGFINRFGNKTVFRSHQSSSAVEWWENAPLGEHVGRMPL